jgi:hypothetical protein
MVAMVTDDPTAPVMGWPILGPGPLLAAAGGAVLLGSSLTVPAGRGDVAWPRLALAAALLAAGAVHLQQAPAQLQSALGVGLVGAAVSQLALGAAVLVRGQRLLWAAVIVDCVALLGFAAYAGLHGASVDLSGAVSVVGEVAGVLLAATLVRR